ncbi:MAG: glycosyltransferase [Alphaproteobacteria bacterium]|nr:glycosyltransferase [Alphaproteobacteria bacterium]
MPNETGDSSRYPISWADAQQGRTKILVMIGAMDIGGCEHDLLRILPKIDRTRFDITVMTYLYAGILSEPLMAAGIRVIAPRHPHRRPEFAPYAWPWLRIFRYKAIFAYIMWIGIIAGWIWRMRHVITTERPDIIHCFLPSTYHLAVPAHLLAKGRGRRRFMMSRVSLGFYFQGHPVIKWWETKFCHNFIDAAAGNSQAVVTELVKENIPSAKTHLIYNGIKIEDFARPPSAIAVGAAQKIITLTAVGNLHPYKGYDDLLAALLCLHEMGITNWQISIAGRDVADNLSRYRHWCQAHNLSDKIQFLGPVHEVRKLLWNSQIHLHLSHTESFPNSILEAMTAGLPVIATRVGGIPELVKPGINGMLVVPQNTTQIAYAIKELCQNHVLRGRMGDAAARIARDEFSLSRSVAAYETMYGAVASNMSKSRS